MPLRTARSTLVAAALSLAACATPASDVPVVQGVDVQRYLGRWHEIAAIPASFQRECAGDTTAEYAAAPDGRIAVTNSCRRADGTNKVATGTARFTDRPGVGRLEVTFLSLLGMPVWMTAGDYWIVALDDQYRWSVVGHPEREYGWILSRTPTLPRSTLLDLRERLRTAGYDTCRFIVTAETARPRLCDL